MAAASVRPTRFFLLLLLVIGGLLPSGCQKRQSPDELYAHVRGEAQRGDLDASLKDANQAFHDYDGKDVGRAWQFRVLKAHVLVMRGSASEALQLLQEEPPASLSGSEIAVRRKVVSGLAHESLQQFGRAEEDLTQAENLARSSQPGLLCDVEQSKGLLETDQRKYSEADIDFHKALSKAREQNKPFLEVNALGALGNSAMQQEHFDAAIDWYKDALTLARSLGSRSSVARALGSLGWSSYELGDFVNALTYYQQGVEESKRSGLIADQIYWLTGVANAQFALRNFPVAETVLTRALELARSQDDKRILAECLNSLSALELETGRVDLAERHNQEATNLENAGLDQSAVRSTILLQGRILAAQHEFPQAEHLFKELIDDPKLAQELVAEAHDRLANLYVAENLLLRAEQEYVACLRTLEAVRTSVREEESRLSFLSNGISFYGDYIDFLTSQGREQDALRVGELSRAQTLEEGLATGADAERTTSRKVRPEQIARHLKATLLFYWLGEKKSHLWVVTPESTTHLTLPAADQINLLVKSYREALFRSRDPLETADSDGRKLYAILVEPAKKLIPKSTRVILLPDGSLYGLNFETLIVPAPKPHYWIEDVTLTTASSLTLLSAAANRSTHRVKSLFLVGNTVSPSADFPSLPQAAAEMQDIERHFLAQHREVLSGGGATPANYLNSKPEKYTYLHFVTHGTASRAQPLESAVILSKDQDDDSYKLYARDIVKRHLSAYLVTISACNGAGTRAYSGEGLVGLSWAFLRAGAHNVIGALWEVSDASTPELMDKLYDGLSHGEDPASALRAAKLSLLHSDSLFRKPYYWAPFQLYAGS